MSLVGIAPLIMAANNDLPAKDVKELIAYAKANPGKISFGSSGVGAAAHLTTELFKQTAGVDMVHVPYKGTAPALQDLMGGSIQILVDVPSTLMPQVRGGKIKALGMFSAKRVAGAAEVPTIAEAGGPPIEGSTWVLFLAPASTPKDIVNRMAAETAKAVTSAACTVPSEPIASGPLGGTPGDGPGVPATQLSKDRGRYYLRRPDRCNDPYLENPTVSFKQGRVYVGAHFAGRIGALIGGVCKSTTEPSAIMLSARPVLRLQEAALEDVRLESADKPMVAAGLQNLIGANSLSRLRVDLLEAVRALTAPDKTAPYAIA